MNYSIKTVSFSLLLLFLMTLALIYLTDRSILTIDFYENSGDPVAGIPSQNQEVYTSLQRWIYLSSAIYLFLKVSLITLILYTALYIAGHTARYLAVLQVVIYSEYLFFIPAITKIILFHRYYPEGTLSDWHKFYILSLLNIFDHAPADWYYALQTGNVFEVMYWFALAYGLNSMSRLGYDRSLRIVVFSYVPVLLIWIALVTFFTLMLFPGTG